MSELHSQHDVVSRQIVGIDVGGANLKYASALGDRTKPTKSWSRSFELWRRYDELASALTKDLSQFGRVDSLAVTMTGELADCFLDRAVGVEHIVQHTTRAAHALGIQDILFYRVDGRFCEACHALAEPDLVAAANWHAMATWVAREIASDGLLVDIGTTTTDIIPLIAGRVATDATTDFQRLRNKMLVYVGCRRTPVCALVASLHFRGDLIGVMNEWFATIDDARIVLAIEPEHGSDLESADGKPRTVAMSTNRLARMIGLDHRDLTLDEAKELAAQIMCAARKRISEAVSSLRDGKKPIILSGHGFDLLDVLPGQRVLNLSELVGAELSRCGPAYAVAELRMKEA